MLSVYFWLGVITWQLLVWLLVPYGVTAMFCFPCGLVNSCGFTKWATFFVIIVLFLISWFNWA